MTGGGCGFWRQSFYRGRCLGPVRRLSPDIGVGPFGVWVLCQDWRAGFLSCGGLLWFGFGLGFGCGCRSLRGRRLELRRWWCSGEGTLALLLRLFATVGLLGGAQLLFHLELEVVGGLAKFVHQLAELAADHGQSPRPEDH